MSDWNQQIIAEFRANEGKVGGMFAKNKLLLLHTIGARSGLERVNPLISLEDGERLVIVASAAGAPSHPDWYHNIVADPEVSVEYGVDTFRARANVANEPERTALYAKMESIFPGFTEYKQKTERTIPVITLTRVD